MKLTDGSRVAVVGGGPAGSFASYFLFEFANRLGLRIAVDIYEPKIFSTIGPGGCNNCGGIVSESLVQMLATEGINLPPTVVQRGIDSYMLHTDASAVGIREAGSERRIAAVHRGSGPRGPAERRWLSFDGYLLELACGKGAEVVRARVEDITRDGDRPRVHVRSGEARTYDLLIGAMGVNSTLVKLFERLGFDYHGPKTEKTYVTEFHMGSHDVTRYLGNSMHVFLQRAACLDFAALIPKGEHATLCILGKDIDQEIVSRFLDCPEARSCFPPGAVATPACHCAPRINVGGARNPFADRIVLIGDAAATRLYKDGIGAAYRTGKASALTAVFQGISYRDFRAHYWPVCRRLEDDNRFGRLVFSIVGIIRRTRILREAVMEMVRREQLHTGSSKTMSSLLWDTFTGSATYKDIFRRGLNGTVVPRLTLESARLISSRRPQNA